MDVKVIVTLMKIFDMADNSAQFEYAAITFIEGSLQRR
jgi:hypothetical protein